MPLDEALKNKGSTAINLGKVWARFSFYREEIASRPKKISKYITVMRSPATMLMWAEMEPYAEGWGVWVHRGMHGRAEKLEGTFPTLDDALHAARAYMLMKVTMK